MTALNIAAVGAGAIGKRHIALVHANRASGLSALVDPSPAAVQTAAAAGVPRFADLGRAVRRAAA